MVPEFVNFASAVPPDAQRRKTAAGGPGQVAFRFQPLGVRPAVAGRLVAGRRRHKTTPRLMMIHHKNPRDGSSSRRFGNQYRSPSRRLSGKNGTAWLRRLSPESLASVPVLGEIFPG